ncbi:MAG: AraC family transcriptional regulator [Oscillospiraceae bacterium]|nr:AraC family transcriptional regulator [Oscillospiraceae bacterium]
MNVNVYSAGRTPLLHIRYMGCNRKPHQVNVDPMLRNSYIIHYVTGGRGFYNGNTVERGQGFLITPGHVEEYHADPNDPWELLWVVSEDPAMEQVFSTFDADPSTGIFSFDYISAVCHAGDTILLLPRRVISCAELLELFLSCYKHHDQSALHATEQSRVAMYVEFALQYFHSNYQSSISIGELTELLGISQPYFFRIFKAATGKSPKQYLGDFRLLQAKKLLSETSLPVGQVAASVGYPDALAFSKFFALRQGISPQKYRQTVK